MEFPDHQFPSETITFPPQSDVLSFIHSYADRFELEKLIKFNHWVIRVAPIENDKWEIIVKDLPNNKYVTKVYDTVFVCNGHLFSPRMPSIQGADEFQGKMIHSHDYRRAEDFRGENVLVIGAGFSGIDLVQQMSKTANRITFSQHKVPNETAEARAKRESLMPSNTKLQDNVKRFTATGAEFIDGTHETFNAVIYATGYNFKYTFLSVDTGIYVDNNHIQPLYKQIVNIEHPTMMFIGIPFSACTTQMFDLQVNLKKYPTRKRNCFF